MRKELNGMFTEGQLVIYGGEGVCRIAAVGPSSLSGTDKTKLYYTLTPLTRSGTVLPPVDTKVLMRPILSRQEAEDFIAQLPLHTTYELDKSFATACGDRKYFGSASGSRMSASDNEHSLSILRGAEILCIEQSVFDMIAE